VQRCSGRVVIVATTAFMALLAITLDPDQEELATSADMTTMLFAFLHGVISVTFALWSLAWCQRRWPTHSRIVGRAARGSFATYFTHPLVLTVSRLLFAAVPLVPEVKFLVISAVASRSVTG
jgi:hypothetical protein